MHRLAFETVRCMPEVIARCSANQILASPLRPTPSYSLMRSACSGEVAARMLSARESAEREIPDC